MKERIGIVIHWIGFLALLISIAFLYWGMTERSGSFDVYLNLMFDFGDSRDGLDNFAFLAFWIAVTQWPIKFIVSSDKSILPFDLEKLLHEIWNQGITGSEDKKNGE